MRVFITYRDGSYRLRDLVKLNTRHLWKLLKHYLRKIVAKEYVFNNRLFGTVKYSSRTYRVMSQISGEVIATTNIPAIAKELVLEEKYITINKTDYPRAYVINEDKLAVFAYYPNRPEFNIDLF